MKLFSLGRTDLAVSSKLPTPVAIEKYRGTIIALRTSVMVWFLDGPLDRRFAHSVQSCDARHTRCRDFVIFQLSNDHKLYSSSSEQIASKITEIHTSVTRSTLMIFLLKVYILLRSVQIACELFCLHSTRYSPISCSATRPPTPFIESPRHEKVNFHRLIELNLIDPEKILEFCIL